MNTAHSGIESSTNHIAMDQVVKSTGTKKRRAADTRREVNTRRVVDT